MWVKVSYALGANPILIFDESLEDLGPKFDQLEMAGAITPEERAALQPYVQARPMEADELVTLTSATVLGTLANPMDPNTIWGVVVPMTDQYILTSDEIASIENSINAFNSTISDYASSHSDRVGLFDLNGVFNTFAQNGATINGSGLTPSFVPPFGGFSLDGVHPNSRGYAYTANRIIEAINKKYNANIPLCNPNDFGGNELPIP